MIGHRIPLTLLRERAHNQNGDVGLCKRQGVKSRLGASKDEHNGNIGLCGDCTGWYGDR